MGKKKALSTIMLPLWLEYPCYSRYGEGWNRGEGHEYKISWFEWLKKLTPEEFEKYKKLFPVPFQWRNYWREEISEDSAYLFIHNHYWTGYWEKNGLPKYLQIKASQKKKKNQSFILETDSQKKIEKDLSSEANVGFQIDQDHYFSVEQYVAVEKARLFGDFSLERKIMKMKSSKEIQRIYQEVSFYEEEMWKRIRFTILLNGTYQKFMQNPKLKEFLLATKDRVLLEEKWRNINLDERVIPAEANELGCLLMEVRDEIGRICRNEKRGRKAETDQQKEFAQLVGF